MIEQPLDTRRRMARDWRVYNQVLRSDFFQRLATWDGQEKTLMDYDLTLAGSEAGWGLVAITKNPESAIEPMAYAVLRPLEEMRTMSFYDIAEHNMQMALSTILLYLERTEAAQ